jgi:lichenan operon transcriptional antiterminator
MEQNSPCTASELAKYLGISIRTVKTYIKDINLLTDSKTILSSNKGYLINKQDGLTFLEKQHSLPQDYL